jgi:hypothetical protein
MIQFQQNWLHPWHVVSQLVLPGLLLGGALGGRPLLAAEDDATVTASASAQATTPPGYQVADGAAVLTVVETNSPNVLSPAASAWGRPEGAPVLHFSRPEPETSASQVLHLSKGSGQDEAATTPGTAAPVIIEEPQIIHLSKPAQSPLPPTAERVDVPQSNPVLHLSKTESTNIAPVPRAIGSPYGGGAVPETVYAPTASPYGAANVVTVPAPRVAGSPYGGSSQYAPTSSPYVSHGTPAVAPTNAVQAPRTVATVPSPSAYRTERAVATVPAASPSAYGVNRPAENRAPNTRTAWTPGYQPFASASERRPSQPTTAPAYSSPITPNQSSGPIQVGSTTIMTGVPLPKMTEAGSDPAKSATALHVTPTAPVMPPSRVLEPPLPPIQTVETRSASSPGPVLESKCQNSVAATVSSTASERPRGTDATSQPKASETASVAAAAATSQTKPKDPVAVESRAMASAPAREERDFAPCHCTTAASAGHAADKDLAAAAVASHPAIVREDREPVAGTIVFTPTLITCIVAAMVLGGSVVGLLFCLVSRARAGRALPTETYQLINAALRTYDAHLSGGLVTGGRMAFHPARTPFEPAPEPPGVATSRDELIRNIIDENLKLRG